MRRPMLRMVERDERQIRSMVRLLDDMLDVSRARTRQAAIVPARFDLVASAQVVVEAIQEQAQGDGRAGDAVGAAGAGDRGRRVPHRAGDHQPADQCAALRRGQARRRRGRRARGGPEAFVSRARPGHGHRAGRPGAHLRAVRAHARARRRSPAWASGCTSRARSRRRTTGGSRCAARPAKAPNSCSRCPWPRRTRPHEKIADSTQGHHTTWTQNAST